jgi:hypothetical protein
MVSPTLTPVNVIKLKLKKPPNYLMAGIGLMIGEAGHGILAIGYY